MTSDSLIGQQLDEYRLDELLGQGGMGRVYRGLDVGLKRFAAVKVIYTPFQQDESYMMRFEREARAIAQLGHPHIVTVYRYGRSDSLLYMAMQYIEGADLHKVLQGYEQADQFMPFDEVQRLISEIGTALDYAHEKGVVHRDIKPSNIMLDSDGRSYLTDFGLALLTEVGTRGEILGSPQYIAPEQAISSAGAVPQSDLYAMGVILYRMLTGTVPFQHEDVLELMMMHMTHEVPSPRQIRPTIPLALEKVVVKALAKEPSERYASGRALADAISAVLTDEALPETIPSPSLTIMERVALDGVTLPPVQTPTAVPEQVTVPNTAVSQPAAQSNGDSFLGLPISVKMFNVIALLVLLVLVGIFGMTRGGREGSVAEEVATPVVVDDVAGETAVEPTVPNTGQDISAQQVDAAATPTLAVSSVDDDEALIPVETAVSVTVAETVSAEENVPLVEEYLSYLPILVKNGTP